MTERALVANAASAKQVKNAGRKENDRRARELDDLRAVMTMPEGRRLIWRLLGFCGFGENPTHQRGDMTHQNIGKADVARMLYSEMGYLGKVGFDLKQLMEREAFILANNEQVEAEALRTPSAIDKATGTADSDAQ